MTQFYSKRHGFEELCQAAIKGFHATARLIEMDVRLSEHEKNQRMIDLKVGALTLAVQVIMDTETLTPTSIKSWGNVFKDMLDVGYSQQAAKDLLDRVKSGNIK